MRNLIILFGVLLAGMGVYFGFIFERDNTSLRPEDIDFAIKDTSAVEGIFLTRVVKGNDRASISLERTSNDTWVLNEEYPAFTPRVRNMLKALHVMQVQKVLPDPGVQSGRRLIDVMHTRVEVEMKRGGTKTYLLGTQTKDAKGSLMQLEDATTPFVVEIPGLQGYMNTYFPMEFNLWRENLLFQGNREYITQISVEYPGAPDNSYTLQRGDLPDEWSVVGTEVQANPERLQEYVFQFTGPIYAESFAAARFPDVLEKLKQRTPDVTMTLQYENGKQRRFFLFDRNDNPNNYFGFVEGSEELLTVQDYVIQKYLVEAGDFFRQAL